jgi:tetratricopeptide (TPR) repeat protein
MKPVLIAALLTAACPLIGALPADAMANGPRAPAAVAQDAGRGRVGDPFTRGLEHYRAGRYAAAVGDFREALEQTPDDPRLNYDLALACWRVGEMDAAETAAEKAAALSKGRFDARRDGILGSLRYDRARQLAADTKDQQTELQNLRQALELATQARGHFQRGALASEGERQGSGAVLVRNLERTIRLQKELEKQIEAAKKRQEEQDKDDKDKQDPDKQDDQKQDDKDKDKNQNKDKDPGKDPGKDKPEPDPKQRDQEQPDPDKDQQPPDPTPEENPEEDKPKPPPQPQEVPGEADPDKQLTPEQRHQLLQRLAEFEAQLKQIKEARRASRPKVKKDW